MPAEEGRVIASRPFLDKLLIALRLLNVTDALVSTDCPGEYTVAFVLPLYVAEATPDTERPIVSVPLQEDAITFCSQLNDPLAVDLRYEGKAVGAEINLVYPPFVV